MIETTYPLNTNKMVQQRDDKLEIQHKQRQSKTRPRRCYQSRSQGSDNDTFTLLGPTPAL